MMREVVSQDNFVFDGGTILDNEELVPVERDGYRTLDEQLQSFREAGERLIENRRYEYQHDEDFMETDLSPLETQGADLVDLDNAAKEMIGRKKKSDEEERKKRTDDEKAKQDELVRKAMEYDKEHAGST